MNGTLNDNESAYLAGNLVRIAEEEKQERTRPSRVMPVTVKQDGNSWCCILGDDLATGVAGFGDSPEEATADFDQEWWTPVNAVGVSDDNR